MALATVLASVMKAAGRPLARTITGSAGRVLLYHRFGSGPSSRRLSSQLFEQHLQDLTRHFRVQPLSEIVRSLEEGRALEPRTVALTVDDGYADFVEYAYPLLQRYRVPATLFVVTDFLEHGSWLWFDALHYLLGATAVPRLDVCVHDTRVQQDLSSAEAVDRAWSAVGEQCLKMNAAQRAVVLDSLQDVLAVRLPPAATPEYRPMTWDDAARLDPSLVALGSHTCSHPVLSRCSDADLAHELIESKRLIERRAHVRVEAFAYPHGEPADYDARATRAAEAAGYSCAVVAHGGPIRGRADRFRLERLPAGSDVSQFRRTVDGLEFLANRYREWRHTATF